MFYDLGILNKQEAIDLGTLNKQPITNIGILSKESAKDLGIIIGTKYSTYALATEDNYKLITEKDSNNLIT